MTDLHSWITQKIDRVDATARAAEPIIHNAMGEYWIAEAEAHLELHSPTAVLRRCEADRRILARHRTDPAQAHDRLFATACHGCGTNGDYADPGTDNLNDCPELLDLAHAHGLTNEILNSLDRPQPPKPTPTQQRQLRRLLAGRISLTSTQVPPALRGPNWKGTKA